MSDFAKDPPEGELSSDSSANIWDLAFVFMALDVPVAVNLPRFSPKYFPWDFHSFSWTIVR